MYFILEWTTNRNHYMRFIVGLVVHSVEDEQQWTGIVFLTKGRNHRNGNLSESSL